MGGPGGGLTASVTLPAHLVTVSGEAEWARRRAPPSSVAAARPARCPVLLERRSAAAHERAGPARAADHARRPPDGRPVDRPTGLNGLPTRTPGSALNRGFAPQPGQAARRDRTGEQPATGGPGPEADAAVAPDAGLAPAG